jgi:hypothetical protein
VIVSPEGGTPDASPTTQISILGPAAADILRVVVKGSRTGSHSGRLVPYAAAPGASFLPARPFAAHERVQVRISLRDRTIREAFSVARPGKHDPDLLPEPPRSRGHAQHFASRPDLFPPRLGIGGTAPPAWGDIFIAPKVGPAHLSFQAGQPGPMILDPTGKLVWFRPEPAGKAAYDFAEQTLGGQPVLTWWEGRVNPDGIGVGSDVIYDSSYRRIARLSGANGYAPDLHEFLLTPSDSALITTFAPVRMDLKSFGGPRNGTLEDSVIQEIDIRTGLVMFEWHALGHLDPRESYLRPTRGLTYDPFHFNSIQPLPNGNMLISARNTSALYEIDPTTGQLVWRLAGKHSNFRIAPGAGFAWQHDARMLADGTISVFDDEATPRIRPQSRALVLSVDESDHVVSVVRQLTHPSPLLAGNQGSVQVLPDGGVFVGWGSAPFASEFDPNGRLVFDLRISAPDESYRAVRAPWSGHPLSPPAIVARRGRGGTTTVYASWNGASNIASWQELAGTNPSALAPVQTVARSGFETVLLAPPSASYVAMRALDASGAVVGTSAVIRPR